MIARSHDASPNTHPCPYLSCDSHCRTMLTRHAGDQCPWADTPHAHSAHLQQRRECGVQDNQQQIKRIKGMLLNLTDHDVLADWFSLHQSVCFLCVSCVHVFPDRENDIINTHRHFWPQLKTTSTFWYNCTFSFATLCTGFRLRIASAFCVPYRPFLLSLIALFGLFEQSEYLCPCEQLTYCNHCHHVATQAGESTASQTSSQS